jgi:hypothetical protein
MEQRIKVFAPPRITTTVNTFDEVAFTPHSKLFHDAPRGRIFRLTRGNNAMEAQRAEAVIDEGACRFRRVPASALKVPSGIQAIVTGSAA